MSVEGNLPAPAPVVVPIRDRVSLKVVNIPNFQEAALRRVITPKVEIDQDRKEIKLISQGLCLTEARSIKQVYYAPAPGLTRRRLRFRPWAAGPALAGRPS
jgi:hypothetical protein